MHNSTIRRQVRVSNEFSNIAWINGDIPRDRPGIYLVWLSKPSLGNRIGTCRVSKGMNSMVVTINGNFEFDCGGLKILAYVSAEGLGPIESE